METNYTISIYTENSVGLLNRVSAIFQESALYKVASKSLFEERHIQNIIKESHANIVTVNTAFFVIEKTGFRHETEQLYHDLAPYGLLQFVRSGRISVTKSPMNIKALLNKLND